jgi:hypothetical protein
MLAGDSGSHAKSVGRSLYGLMDSWKPRLSREVSAILPLPVKHLAPLLYHVREHLVRAWISVSDCMQHIKCTRGLPGIYSIKQNQKTGGIAALILPPGAMALYSNRHSAPIPIG